MPCNYHLRRLSEKVKAGIRAAGGTPIEYNTIAVSDGIAMGTEGMKASLISREVIADSIELVARGHLFDAVVALSGCDKTIPGTVMALARLNVPSLMLYGGSIMPGRFQGRDVTIQDVFEAVGAHAAGKLSDADLCEVEGHACPGAGACGGPFTANPLGTAFAVPRHRTHPRTGSPRGDGDARAAGGAFALGPDQDDRRAGDPEGQPRAGRVCDQDRRPRAPHPQRPGTRVRLRGGGDACRPAQRDPA